MKEKSLILIRGTSGSGKTTLAKLLAGDNFPVFEADSYFYNKEGVYEWAGNKLRHVHELCLNATINAMELATDKIFVSNTFAPERELRPYITEAEKYGYKVFVIVVENRHEGVSIHDVPNHSIENQKNRLRNSIKL